MFKKIKMSTDVKNLQITESFVIQKNDCVIAIGSCFVENIVDKLFQYGLNCLQNPTGIIYNSDSMLKAVELVCNRQFYTENDLFKYNDKFHSWLHHGMFSKSSVDESLTLINDNIEIFYNEFKNANFLILTPASSVVYVYNETNQITANCHKVPNNQFAIKILSVEENYHNLRNIVKVITEFNPQIKIIFTLSPVRHYPGNVTLNSRSKAQLLAAIYQVIDEFRDDCCYFPAYEVMSDQLRDYRFYNEDLVHPNEVAQRIIFQLFIENFTSKELQNTMQQNAKNIRQQQHRQK